MFTEHDAFFEGAFFRSIAFQSYYKISTYLKNAILVSGQLKLMMDRCVVLRPSYEQPYAMTGKIGGAIACAGFRHGGQELTLQNIHTFLLQLHVQVISDGPGYSHSGAAIVGEAKDDALGLEMAANLARNIVNLLKKQQDFQNSQD